MGEKGEIKVKVRGVKGAGKIELGKRKDRR